MRQTSADQLLAQLLGILPDLRSGGERMLVAAVGLDVTPDVFVEEQQALIRHQLRTHTPPLPWQCFTDHIQTKNRLPAAYGFRFGPVNIIRRIAYMRWRALTCVNCQIAPMSVRSATPSNPPPARPR